MEHMETFERTVGCIKSQAAEQKEQLLPGLPDDITVDLICTKLPWGAFHTLSSVSLHWLHAIQSRRIHNARVRSHSTETIIVVKHFLYEDGMDLDNFNSLWHYNRNSERELAKKCWGVSLYSMRENRFYKVPDIPHCDQGFPEYDCQFMALNGMVYCLGQSTSSPIYSDRVDQGERVLIRYRQVWCLDRFDLVGAKQQWEQRAGTENPRSHAHCGVVDGKIYSCGGPSALSGFDLRGCEVYDSQENAWSSIAAMQWNRFGHNVTTLGGELLLSGGCLSEKIDNGVRGTVYRSSNLDLYPLGAYNPGKDEWRLVKPLKPSPGKRRPDGLLDRLFVAHGKLHLMSSNSILFLDGCVEDNLWRELHTFSMKQGIDGFVGFNDKDAIVEMDGELLVAVNAYFGFRGVISCLLRNKGFGSKTKELVWEKVNGHLCFPN